METRIETTNRIDDCLEQGGICGRVVSYDAAVIAKIMDCDIDEAAEMDGSEYVPNCGPLAPRLAEYLNYHGYKGRVVKKGHKIQ